MHTDHNQSIFPSRQEFNPLMPKPGEIWEVSRRLGSPLLSPKEDQQNLYSELARRFLDGNSPPRYVMIVKEPLATTELEEELEIVTVMLLSTKTGFISDVDLLLPTEVSGVGQDLLVQTWHVLPMLTYNLSQPVGQRLSREIYNLLLTIGDCYHGLVTEAPSIQKIQPLGLRAGTVSARKHPEIQLFHQQQEDWSDVFLVPLAEERTYLKSIKLADALLHEALLLERELAEVATGVLGGSEVEGAECKAFVPAALAQMRVNLSRWFENIFEAQWQSMTSFWGLQGQKLALATRNSNHFKEVHSDLDEVMALIDRLASSLDEHQRRHAAKRLGKVATGHPQATQALVELLHTTQDDEMLWTAVESLWKVDPGNPAAGVRRVKLVDLGMQVAGQAVALAVASVQKANQQFGILLNVYPMGNEPYLPVGLKLILLDGLGQVCREVTARSADIYIQLKFCTYPGEQFSVRVMLGQLSITEDFET